MRNLSQKTSNATGLPCKMGAILSLGKVSGIRLPLRVGLQVGLHYGMATFPNDGRTIGFLVKMSDSRLYAAKKQNIDTRKGNRRYPRFAIPGITLTLGRGRARRKATDVRDIGYGGLAFLTARERVPPRLEGEIAQRFSSETHQVAMRAVSVVPLRGGRLRVGCAFEH
jgi:hypothetical protein